jgi:type IV fimbrial biogenesis protein FimT
MHCVVGKQLSRIGRQRGFTLLELMISLTVFAILVSLAVPSFRNLMLNNTLTAAGNDLLASLQTARGEALKRNQQVVLCLTANVTAATPSCAGAATTANAWFVFQDTNANGAYDAGEPIIELHSALNSGEGIHADSAQSVIIAPSGFPSANFGQTQNVLFCDSRGLGTASTSLARALLISTTGHGTVVNTLTAVTAAKTAIGSSATCP